jgi:hypothetical protein
MTQNPVGESISQSRDVLRPDGTWVGGTSTEEMPTAPVARLFPDFAADESSGRSTTFVWLLEINTDG